MVFNCNHLPIFTNKDEEETFYSRVEYLILNDSFNSQNDSYPWSILELAHLVHGWLRNGRDWVPTAEYYGRGIHLYPLDGITDPLLEIKSLNPKREIIGDNEKENRKERIHSNQPDTTIKLEKNKDYFSDFQDYDDDFNSPIARFNIVIEPQLQLKVNPDLYANYQTSYPNQTTAPKKESSIRNPASPPARRQ